MQLSWSLPFRPAKVHGKWGLALMPGRHKWRGVCAEENAFRDLSCYAMATLAAHDPGHGAHRWCWMKTRLFSWLQRSLHRRCLGTRLSVSPRRSTIMTGQIPEGSGETSQLYPCKRNSTQENHGEARGKQTKINCTLPKTSVPEQTR